MTPRQRAREPVHEMVLSNFLRLIEGRTIPQVARESGVDYEDLRMAVLGRSYHCQSGTIALLAKAAGVEPSRLLDPVGAQKGTSP